MSMIKVNSAIELIGKTPLVKLNRLVPNDAADVYVKLESFNVGGSIKDRIALNMIEKAEKAGHITPGKTTLVEATSGNTGIGLALVAAIKGYRLVIVMSEKASVERRKLLRAYGAELVLVPASPEGIKADLAKLEELVRDFGYFPLRQFENEHNPETHKETTGPEIVEALDGKVPDAFVAGIGTGGTITGTGEYLKSIDPGVKIIAVEPASSPVLNGGKPGPHAIQGIGSGIIPKVLNTSIYDEVIDITDEAATDTARELAVKEGLLLGYSSGAAVNAAIKAAIKLGAGKTVVVIAPDTGERYLSMPVFNFGY
ncbi:MAG: cysteine synthase [Firmicutes bacterium]|nr:cysteine synthase [Bacillota bacterium]